MFSSINEVAVLGCTLLMLAVFTLWYAFLYQKSEQAHTEITELSIGGACIAVLVCVLAFALTLPIDPRILALASSFFGAALMGLFSLKERLSIKEFFIHAGFAMVFCIGTIFTLYYWPW